MTEIDATITARRAARSGLARAIRLAAALSQAEVGRHCGVSGAAVSRWETGRRVPRGKPGVRYGELITRLRGAG